MRLSRRPDSFSDSSLTKTYLPIAGATRSLAWRRSAFGRGGGVRKLHLLSQVLSCQRRSTAALPPIGVKWCQDVLHLSGNAGGLNGSTQHEVEVYLQGS